MWRFSAFRPPENGPRHKVVRKFDETVLLMGGHKEGVACRKGKTLLADKQHALSAMDKVKLILRVGGLIVMPARREENGGHRAVSKGFHIPDTFRPCARGRQWKPGERIKERQSHDESIRCARRRRALFGCLPRQRFLLLLQCLQLLRCGFIIGEELFNTIGNVRRSHA